MRRAWEIVRASWAYVAGAVAFLFVISQVALAKKSRAKSARKVREAEFLEANRAGVRAAVHDAQEARLAALKHAERAKIRKVKAEEKIRELEEKDFDVAALRDRINDL